MTVHAFAVFVLFAACSASRLGTTAGVWSPNEVEMVSKALDTIMNQPHLSKEQLASAQLVATKVRANLKAVESGKLKGPERKAKVSEAIAALTGLEAEWTERTKKAKAAMDATDAHLAKLQKELAEKQALMAKESDQMKVLTLEKDLMEKKLKLDTLMEKKQAMAEQKAKEQEDADRKAIFQTLAAVSQNMSSADAKNAALSHLKARAKSIQGAIASIDEDDKADQKKMEGMKLDVKMSKMLKSVEKKSHREHAKAKALKSVELANLDKAIQSVEAGDSKGAKDALDKMERDAKRLDAKSGNFLH